MRACVPPLLKSVLEYMPSVFAFCRVEDGSFVSDASVACMREKGRWITDLFVCPQNACITSTCADEVSQLSAPRLARHFQR